MQVLTGGEGGFANYRCPALVRTAAGSLLLSTDARNSRSDWGWLELLVTRSTDDGRTWSEPVFVNAWHGGPLKNNGGDHVRNRGVDPAVNPQEKLTFSNQTLIPDADGRVHLLYFVEYCRAMYRVSEDDGVTWSEPVEVTASAFEPYRPAYPWKVIAAGPGAGIQLSRGPHKGRLLAPFWMARGGADSGSDHRPSVTGTIYSDNGGATWLPGEITAHEDQPLHNPSENLLVELADGRVMANIRSESEAHRRAVTISLDGVSGWSPLEFDKSLYEPVCHAGLTRMAGVTGHENTLVFSNPDPSDKSQSRNALGFRVRENLTIHVSPDEGRTWPHRRAVYRPGLTGYSALASAPDGTIWCAYEHQAVGGDRENFWNVSVARFNLAWVKAGG